MLLLPRGKSLSFDLSKGFYQRRWITAKINTSSLKDILDHMKDLARSPSHITRETCLSESVHTYFTSMGRCFFPCSAIHTCSLRHRWEKSSRPWRHHCPQWWQLLPHGVLEHRRNVASSVLFSLPRCPSDLQEKAPCLYWKTSSLWLLLTVPPGELHLVLIHILEISKFNIFLNSSLQFLFILSCLQLGLIERNCCCWDLATAFVGPDWGMRSLQ